jgi:hypothetical protein
MQPIRQGAAASVLIALSALLVGCGIPRSVGLAERCADIMKSAYPSAAIDITKSEAAATSLTTIIARVEGSRSDLPPEAPLRRELAAQCRFDENILIEFHWTAGPLH